MAGPSGHGGAYATQMWIERERQLITVFMMPHAGDSGTDGGKIYPAFTKAAQEALGK